MTLQEKLEAVQAEITANYPDLAARFDADTKEGVRSGVGSDSLVPGSLTPDFELPDQLGRAVRSSDLRVKGPLVISFYRGGWCPYCNLELRALQDYLPQITEVGATLIAISPQVPDESLSTVEKNKLSFPVLSDVGNVVARQFGLVFILSAHLRPLYAQFGIDLQQSNGNDTFELPVAGTFIIDSEGIIESAYVNADYKQRMEPAQILERLAELE